MTIPKPQPQPLTTTPPPSPLEFHRKLAATTLPSSAYMIHRRRLRPSPIKAGSKQQSVLSRTSVPERLKCPRDDHRILCVFLRSKLRTLDTVRRDAAAAAASAAAAGSTAAPTVRLKRNVLEDIERENNITNTNITLEQAKKDVRHPLLKALIAVEDAEFKNKDWRKVKSRWRLIDGRFIEVVYCATDPPIRESDDAAVAAMMPTNTMESSIAANADVTPEEAGPNYQRLQIPDSAKWLLLDKHNKARREVCSGWQRHFV